jgi:galactokinase
MPLIYKDLTARVDSAASDNIIFKSEKVVRRKNALLRKIMKELEGAYNPEPDDEVYAYFVPGRIEVFGKHTDYAGGHSLLFSMDRGFHSVCKANKKEIVRIRDINPFYGQRIFEFSDRLKPLVGDWANYPMTLIKRLCKNFGTDLKGVDIVFGSDLPPAGGMSSSSALMIMVFLAIASVNGLFDQRIYRRNIANNLDLAMYLACAENGQTFRGLEGERGVGTFGGSEDHTIIMNGKQGTISLYQFAPTLHKADISLPNDLAYVILYSGVSAEKTGEAMRKYNMVARRAKLVVERYNQACGTDHRLLRDIVEENKRLNADAMLAKVRQATASYREQDQDLDLAGRFRQFCIEDRELIPEATKALASHNHEDLARVTNLSHEASKTYLWNIAPEIEFLQKKALKLGALAASGFGAGFGGSAYALVPTKDAPRFAMQMKKAYTKQFPKYSGITTFFQAHPSSGACELFSSP